MEPVQKIVEKEEQITDEQRTLIYTYATKLSKDSVNELCPALLQTILRSEKGTLKNQLGQVIFHLQKTERINTLIGLQKLIDAMLIVDPEGLFKLLESSEPDAQQLAKNIKSCL